jgi:hypothetical protein
MILLEAINRSGYHHSHLVHLIIAKPGQSSPDPGMRLERFVFSQVKQRSLHLNFHLLSYFFTFALARAPFSPV